MTKDLSDTRNFLKQDGYAVFRYDTKPVHSFPYDSPWIDDKEFSRFFELIRNNTLVDRTRCYDLYLLMEQIQKIEGDILEIGTWRGGTAAILAKYAKNKTVYLADTFTGVVKSAKWEHYQDDAHNDTSEELVVNFLKDKIHVHNFKILKGIFPEHTGDQLMDKKLSMVHIDVDVYQSAKDAMNYVWNQLSVGGIVVFDDFGFVSACSGIYKFVNEIKHDSDKLFIQNINGHAIIIKR